MKRVLTISTIVIAICSLAIAQEMPEYDVFAGVEIGSGNYYLVQMTNGSTHHVRIVSVDKDKTLLMQPSGNTFIINTNNILSITEKEFSNSGSIGVGFGVPYGVLGFNAEFKLFKVLYVTGGIGTGIFITPIYNVGGKLYLRSGNNNFRPRVSAYYGINGMLVVQGNYSSNITESYTGVTVGAGACYSLGITRSWAFDFDIMYITDDSEIEGRIQELKRQGYEFDFEAVGNVKLSAGVRFTF